jgi:hypothetical protein
MCVVWCEGFELIEFSLLPFAAYLYAFPKKSDGRCACDGTLLLRSLTTTGQPLYI